MQGLRVFSSWGWGIGGIGAAIGQRYQGQKKYSSAFRPPASCLLLALLQINLEINTPSPSFAEETPWALNVLVPH